MRLFLRPFGLGIVIAFPVAEINKQGEDVALLLVRNPMLFSESLLVWKWFLL